MGWKQNAENRTDIREFIKTDTEYWKITIPIPTLEYRWSEFSVFSYRYLIFNLSINQSLCVF